MISHYSTGLCFLVSVNFCGLWPAELVYPWDSYLSSVCPEKFVFKYCQTDWCRYLRTSRYDCIPTIYIICSGLVRGCCFTSNEDFQVYHGENKLQSMRSWWPFEEKNYPFSMLNRDKSAHLIDRKKKKKKYSSF
jgi:hypothetical protein